MITSTAFAGKHYAVLGLARSGLATVDALLASGARVTAWDDKEEARDALASSPRGGEGWGEGVQHLCEITDFTTTDLSVFDSIVVTPGLPLNRHPIAAHAKAASVEIIGDIELFARARAELPPHKVVGITGTNGKSTTTALVHHILKTAGVPSRMGGNIGLPILAQDPLPEGGVYVLELSSYQIDLTQTLDCDVAVLLNITPDHLDRYESFEAYAASKVGLFEMQSAGRAGWMSADTSETKNIFRRLLKDPERLLGEIEPLVVIDQNHWLSLRGPHNAQNAAAAIEVCSFLGVDEELLEAGLSTFSGLSHRMERVAEKKGVLFVNDSKATNAEAAAPALTAYPRVRWIVGGQAKAETLGETASHLGHVIKAYAIGEAGPMLARMLREAKVDVAECGTLDVAVKVAASDAQSGDTVLLSPACASFDQFKDFEARGNAFRAAVEAL